MFTGLVWQVGTLQQKINHGRDLQLVIALQEPTSLELGESIAVNGACLSVETCTALTFTVYASEETLSCTTIKTLPIGCHVNLERALSLADRLGGHLVSGHVDCLATVESISRVGRSLQVRVRFPKEHSPCVLTKGSVCLDGISLTVNSCGAGFLTVNIIPDTQKRTNMGSWKAGTQINLETDLIGKYVQNLLAARAPAPNLDLNFLRTHGFL